MKKQTRLALVAHDKCKEDMVSWCRVNRELLEQCELWATGNTGKIVADETGLVVSRVSSGPLGGDMEIGAKIVQNQLDVMVFLWDPLSPQPHDPDIKALLRVAALKNIVVATNIRTADCIISALSQG